MLGKIYLKLYFWFVLIFVLTLLTVSLLASRFYGSSVHAEIENQMISNARFVLSEYQDSCARASHFECQKFLKRLERVRQLRFWILDRTGAVQFSNDRRPPGLGPHEIERAASGEIVTSFLRHAPPRVVMPLQDSSGNVTELFVLERSFLPGRRFPRFPLMASLLLAGLVIAILVLPLSLRLTRPIRHLHQLGQAWAEGQLEKRAIVTGTDEISDLGRVFNTMAENLQKMLQQRKEFLALISHELKSPLARMRIALELLADQKADHSKLIKDLEADIHESEQLIEQLLVLSRIEMTAPGSYDQTVDVGLLLRKSIEQVEPLTRNSGHIVHFEDGTATIHGDAVQLQRAITNILENAIKFSPAGTTVGLSVKQQDRVVLIQCKDEGAGISPHEKEKIFEPFYRGRSSGEKEGSGLGLFIARRIIEMHKGNIEVLPNQPVGTIIQIELPA